MPVQFRLRKTRGTGQVLAELPVMLIVLLFGFTIPLIVFATLGYRAVLLWSATRAACQVAAKNSNYTSASSAATAALATQTNANTNIVINSSTVYTVVEPVNSSGTFFAYPRALASGDTGYPISSTNYVYFVRLSVTGTIQPLFQDSILISGVPGLTAGIPLTIASENFLESPNGWGP